MNAPAVHGMRGYGRLVLIEEVGYKHSVGGGSCNGVALRSSVAPVGKQISKVVPANRVFISWMFLRRRHGDRVDAAWRPVEAMGGLINNSVDLDLQAR